MKAQLVEIVKTSDYGAWPMISRGQFRSTTEDKSASDPVKSSPKQERKRKILFVGPAYNHVNNLNYLVTNCLNDSL